MLRNLASIMIRPRATLRRILDAGRDRMVIPLVLLAAVSGFISDIDQGSLDALSRQQIPFAVLFIAILVAVSLALLLCFYIVSWAVYWLGKLMEGTGTPREIRSAVAWGLAPGIWALLYRVPVLIFSPQSLETKLKVGDLQIDAGRTSAGCFMALLLAALEMTVIVWWAVTTSNTIGEAHRFSSTRGFATLLVVLISPFVIVLAAVLAS